MSWELESVDALMSGVKSRHSVMSERLTRSAKGEPFALRELAKRGTMTPSQLAMELKSSSGRVSALLASLEKKGYITREIDPSDRRNILVNLTEAGRRKNAEHVEEMRAMMCWVFQQMGERRTREFVDLVVEFMTYASLCGPEGKRPTKEQIDEAFAEAKESPHASS